MVRWMLRMGLFMLLTACFSMAWSATELSPFIPDPGNTVRLPVHVLPPPLQTPSFRVISQIDTIVVDGDIKVNLYQLYGKRKEFYDVKGSPFLVQAYLQGRTLHLKSATGYVQPIQVTVGVRELEHLVVNGHASVSAARLNTPSLGIVSHSTGNIDLRGTMGLWQLVTTAPTRVNIEWVNSQELRVRNTGNAHIRLAGITHDLQVQASKHGQVDAQFLRALIAFVQTKDDARINVHVSHSLRGFAFDRSNIYYYTAPQHITKLSKDSANILEMVDRP